MCRWRLRPMRTGSAHAPRCGWVIEHADHSFHVLKRSGWIDEQVLDELSTTAAEWVQERT